MAEHLALEMRQYANPVEEVLSALDQVFSSHDRVKRLKREGHELRFDFKVPIIAPGGESWILKAEPFLDGTIVTAFVRKGIAYQATSAAADRMKVQTLLVSVATALVGRPANGTSPSAPLIPTKAQADWTQLALSALDHAEHCSARGDGVGEELSIWLAVDTAAPNGKPATEWLSKEVSARVDAGRLRRSVEVIGEIGEDVTLMSDRVLCKRRIKDLRERTVRPLDADVTASVINGSATASLAKPSLVTMAMRTALPNKANFVLTHPRWELSVPVDPAAVHRVSDLAERVNTVTRRAPHDESARSSAPDSPSASAASMTDQLRQLAALHKDGVLTDEEFAGAKAKLLGS